MKYTPLFGALLFSSLFSSVGSAQTMQAPASTPIQTSQQAVQPQPEQQYPTVTVGTLTYIQYDAELRNRDGFNAFDITRGYINITGDLAKNIKFRLTPDLKRQSDGSLGGSLVFRLKYGFVELDNLTPRSWLRVGMQQTPWLDFEESINRYRVQGTMFTEREGIIPGSADFGVGYLTQFPGSYGEIHAGVYNGEGYAHAEANEHKSFQGRLTVRPFPQGKVVSGFRLSGFFDFGRYAKGLPRRHGIVMGSFEHPKLVTTLQWFTATERPTPSTPADFVRGGYSTFAEVRQGTQGWAGFARFDRFDPDKSVVDNSTRRIITGVAYWMQWSKVRLGFVFDDEDVRYGEMRKIRDENRFLAQTHVQF